ncbi:MAG: hypothetical protein R3A80_05500 [Bdellovibrionota bacterium]
MFVWCKKHSICSWAILFSLLSLTARAEDIVLDDHEEVTKAHVSSMREWAYRNFGPKFWKDVGGWNYPVYEKKDLALVDLPELWIPLKAGETPNSGALASSWVPIPVNKTKTYYRAEYLFKSIEGIDVDQVIADATAYYKDVKKRSFDPFSSYKDKAAELNNLKTLAKVTMALFPTDQFELRFFPNKKLLYRTGGKSSASGATLQSSPRGGITWKDSYGKISREDNDKLVGIFKGTFTNEDAPGRRINPGLIVDHQVIDKLRPELATLSIADNNEIRIGLASDINEAAAKMLRQNEYPILRKGELHPEGAYPTGWNNYSDGIMRSYLAVTSDGKYFVYVFAMHAHTSMVAMLLKNLGFSDAMVLDIHPAIAADFARPMILDLGADQKAPDFFKSSQSYGLVPHEDDANTGMIDTVFAWGASVGRGRAMQWMPSNAKGKSSDVDAEEDFFGVFINE